MNLSFLNIVSDGQEQTHDLWNRLPLLRYICLIVLSSEILLADSSLTYCRSVYYILDGTLDLME